PAAPDYAGLLATSTGPINGDIVVAGALSVPGPLDLRASGLINLSGATTAGLTQIEAGSVQFGALTSSADVAITAATSADLGGITATGAINVSSGGLLTLASADAGDRITLDAAGAVTAAGTLRAAAGDVFVRGSNVDLRSINAATDIGLLASGTLASGALTSGRDLILLGNTITTGAIATPDSGRVRFGNFTQGGLLGFTAGVPSYAALLAAAIGQVQGDISVNGFLTAGLLEASTAGRFQAREGVDVTAGAIVNGTIVDLLDANSAGFININSVNNLLLGNLTAEGGLALATAGDITTGNLDVGGTLSLTTTQVGGIGGALVTGTIRASDDIRLNAATTLTTGALSAADSVFLAAGGTIITGNIDAGTVMPASGAAGVVFASTPGTISTGAINVSGSATLSGVLGVTTGNVTAPGGIVLLDTGGISAGALSTSPNGFIYIASHEMLPQITFDPAGNPLFATLLASTPTRLVGDISLSGAANTGLFVAAATGGFNAQTITAPTNVLVDVGGTATLAGSVTSANTSITSSDIAIADGIIIGGNGATNINLTADGNVLAAIGGAAVDGSYSLTNAEFAALRASNINVRLNVGTMTVNQLDLPASVPGQSGQTGQPQAVATSVTLRSGGVLRVTGPVTMAQATSANNLSLFADSRIEVVQGSGRIQLGSTADMPAATLTLTANRVRVASDTLLGQIASGSLTGIARDQALNAAATNLASGGSLIADIIRINAAQDVLIQNSGDAQTSAGFTAGSGGVIITAIGSPNELVELVLNGRVLGEDGNFVVNDGTRSLITLLPDPTRFAAGAQINGCALVSGCAVEPPPPPPEPPPPPPSPPEPQPPEPPSPPEPQPQLPPEQSEQQVAVIVNNVVALTPDEEQQREEAQEAVEKLPIVVLQRLIDFSPLFAAPDTNDPAASGGNPALWLDPSPSGVRRPGGLK
ncbi:beta strand repeat-containing protein, partial [Sandarakinorhabdus sp.]|uniref:beta strand repeat-containing protein n=1 Tax=Sandarakinorhabdus sp. TaxID=1916663 RepID=UPI003F718377